MIKGINPRQSVAFSNLSPARLVQSQSKQDANYFYRLKRRRKASSFLLCRKWLRCYVQIRGKRGRGEGNGPDGVNITAGNVFGAIEELPPRLRPLSNQDRALLRDPSTVYLSR
ncbi:hypothetical protein KC356_g21 [Hortaea werneckii]|nr:hypothetical protein KC356_g21 [Hortaea werneckii]